MPLDNLIEILQGLCPSVIEQGTMAAEATYPERFYTFWNPATDNHKHYDNTTYGYTWTVEVNAYAHNPDIVASMLEDARVQLIAAGWKINGKGHGVASDDPNYSGRGFTALYLEL